MTTPAQVVAEARSWLDTPFAHQGRAKGHGCDCAGVVTGVMRELNLSDYDVTDYGRQPNGDDMRRLCDQNLIRVPARKLSPGCAALIRFSVEPQHLAVVGDYFAGGLSLVHALVSAGKVTEHRLNSVWRARIVAVYHLPGVVYG